MMHASACSTGRTNAACRRFLTSTALATGLLVLPAAPSAAQDSGAEEPFYLGELVLSGSKRNETLEDYAGSVSVVSSEALIERGISDGLKAVSETPGMNLNFVGDRQNTYITVRGVGPMRAPLSPDDSSVLTFVDGAPLMLAQSASSYLDLEQVEVFKGPQNTTFGRSTSGGAINLVPVLPQDVTEGSVRAEYGTDNKYLLEVIGNTPIIDDELNARIALRHTGRDAYLDNTAGPDFGQEEITAGRLSLLYTPSALTSVLLTYAGEKVDVTPPYYIGQIGDGDLLDGAQTYSEDKSTSHQLSLKVEHDFERFRFTSQTSYNTMDADGLFQLDHVINARLFGVPESAFAVPENNRLTNFREQTRLTQELRLSSLPEDRISWVAGLVAYRDDTEVDRDNHVSFFGGRQAGYYSTDLTTEGVAVFADATVPVGDKLSFSGGLRLSRETKEIDAQYDSLGFDLVYPGVVPQFLEQEDETYNFWTGKLAVSYDWTDDVSTYASVSRGYKTGGFGVFNPTAAFGEARVQYDSATTLSYEIGGRANLMNGALTLSGTAFYVEMSDEQILLYDYGSFDSQNANIDAKSKGVEIEADWLINDNWQLNAGVAYTKTKITDVPDSAAGAIPKGNDLPLTPKWAVNLGLGYRAYASDLGWTSANAPTEISARLAYSYLDDRFYDAANLAKMDSVGLVSGRIGLHWDNSELYVFGDNLTDESYLVSREYFGPDPVTGLPAYGVTPGLGRSIGVGYSMKF